MIKLYHFFFFFLISSSIQSCTWCHDAGIGRPYSQAHFFMKNYFTCITPSIQDLMSIYKTMCVDAFSEALKIQIELLTRKPSKYFKTNTHNFSEHHLRTAVKTCKQITQFIHSQMVHLKTKTILPYSYHSKTEEHMFLSEYLARNAKKDAFGCTLFHDIHAYALSFAGTLFNSYLLRNKQNNMNEQEMRPLIFLFNEIDFLGAQLRNTPYQRTAEKNIQLWTRLFKTLEQEWEAQNQHKRR